MWFQVAECNAVNASLLLNLINNNFLIFLTENLPILNPYLPQNLKICDPILVTLSKMRPHYWLIIDYSHSSRENSIPSSGTSPLGSCKGVPPPRDTDLVYQIQWKDHSFYRKNINRLTEREFR